MLKYKKLARISFWVTLINEIKIWNQIKRKLKVYKTDNRCLFNEINRITKKVAWKTIEKFREIQKITVN